MLAVAPVPTRTRPATTPRSARTRAAAASRASRARPPCSRSTAPARVSAARLPMRSRRGSPRPSSSWRTWRLTAGWLRWRESAAREKLPRRAISCSVRRWAGLTAIAMSIYNDLYKNNLFYRWPSTRHDPEKEDDHMEPIHVRFATLDDAPAICTIYNQGIDDRVATLETELRDAEERRRWLSSRGTRYPVVAAEARGQIIGWSSLNPFNPRRAYDHVADISVYVERSWRGRGAGRVLLQRLVALGRGLHFHKLVLACFPTNQAGVAVSQRMGFAPAGLCHEQGTPV